MQLNSWASNFLIEATYRQPRRLGIVSRLNPLFNVVLIETCNTCTRSCDFCLFGTNGHPQRKLMPLSLIQLMVGELKQLNYHGRVSPFGINEPLTDPRIFEIIRLIKTEVKGAFVSINSNGDLLTPAKLADLWSAGLDALAISIYDQAAWDRIHSMLSPDDMNQVRINDVRVVPDHFDNRADARKATDGTQRETPCLRPQNMIVVRHTGKVALCCADMQAWHSMGNANNSSLADIWYSEAFKYVRGSLTQARSQPPCLHCNHNGSTSPAAHPMHLKR